LVIEFALSVLLPPKVLSHSLLPLLSSFIIQASNPPAPFDPVLPATIYPPSNVWAIENASSS